MRADSGMGAIEIILAIVFLAMLAVISIPQVQRYQASRDLRHAARLIGGDMRLTQQYAVTQNENFRLVYVSSPTSNYTIQKVSDGSVVRSVDLPTTVTVTSTFVSNRVEFSSTGAPAASGAFCLTDGTTTMKVDIQPATGRLQLAEVTSCP